MEDLKPKNYEEWKIHNEWLKKHLDNGASIVVDEKTNAIIRVEYDNPIYSFYKTQYTEKKMLMDLLCNLNKNYLGNLEITSQPPKIEEVNVRIYKDNNPLIEESAS